MLIKRIAQLPILILIPLFQTYIFSGNHYPDVNNEFSEKNYSSISGDVLNTSTEGHLLVRKIIFFHKFENITVGDILSFADKKIFEKDTSIPLITKLENRDITELKDSYPKCLLKENLINKISFDNKYQEKEEICFIPITRYVSYNGLLGSLKNYLNKNSKLNITKWEIEIDKNKQEKFENENQKIYHNDGMYIPPNHKYLRWKREEPFVGGSNSAIYKLEFLTDGKTEKRKVYEAPLAVLISIKDKKVLSGRKTENEITKNQSLLVKKGRDIEVNYKLKNIRINFYATAREDGFLGDIIKIYKKKTKQYLKAKVIGLNKVSLNID
jgi:uncharacterized protein YrrD